MTNKCTECGQLATHNVPELLCARHWAEWFTLGDDDLSPEQKKEFLDEVIETMLTTTFVFLKEASLSQCGKYSVAANTPGYISEYCEDNSVILEFTLKSDEGLIFPRCKVTSDKYVVDKEHKGRIRKSLDG